MRYAAFCIALIVFSFGSSHAQVTSLKSGAWEDPGVWSNGSVPDDSTDVLIITGDTINLPVSASGPAMTCRSLEIQAGALCLLIGRNFTVHQETRVYGTFMDTLNAGVDVFGGKVSILGDGRWDTRALTNPTRLNFENGLEHRGDSLLINRCSFTTHDQSLTGTTPIVFSGNITIESGITLTNEAERLVYAAGAFQGDTLNSVFRNKTTFEVGTNVNLSRNVKLDFTEPGNKVVIKREGVFNLYPVTYYDLVLARQEGFNNLRRNLQGPTRVLHDLNVEANTQLVVGPHSIVVDGTFRTANTLLLNESSGSLECENMELMDAWIDGMPTAWGTVHVRKDLTVTGPDARINEVDLTIDGSLIVEGDLVFNSESGSWQINALRIEEGGSLGDNNIDREITFEKPVLINGSLQGTKALYRFLDEVTVGDSGLLRSTGATSRCHILGGLVNHGKASFNSGSVVLGGAFSGSQAIVFGTDALIGAGLTLTNLNTQGLEFQKDVKGEDGSSHFENRGLLIISTANNTVIPFSVGTKDFCTYPGNTVLYAAPSNNQRIAAGCYRNVSFTQNTKMLTDGDILVLGDIHNEVELKENNDLFNPGPIRLSGDADQQISGNGTFRTLEIDKSGGRLVSQDTFFVSKSLIMLNGILEAQEGSIGLLGISTLAETETSYVLGRIGTERNLLSGANSFGGIGITITADPDQPLGSTRVVRVTGEAFQAGQVNRYFEITPANNNNLNATVEFFYREAEINGAVEANLDMVNAPDGENFEVLGGRNLTLSNIVRKSAIDRLGIISLRPFTVAVNAFPSPFTEAVTISYVLERSEPVWVSIFDNAGRVVLREELDGVAGYNEWVFDRPLKGGIYYVSVVTSDRKGMAKMVHLNP
jgi:hypothetical protein